MKHKWISDKALNSDGSKYLYSFCEECGALLDEENENEDCYPFNGVDLDWEEKE